MTTLSSRALLGMYINSALKIYYKKLVLIEMKLSELVEVKYRSVEEYEPKSLPVVLNGVNNVSTGHDEKGCDSQYTTQAYLSCGNSGMRFGPGDGWRARWVYCAA